MHKKDRLYLNDIVESINAINSYTNQINFEEFQNSRKTFSATIRELEIIGEAVGKLSDSIKKKYPDVKWRDIKDMRNILIHEYFGVDLGIIWKVIQQDIPKLEKITKSILDRS